MKKLVLLFLSFIFLFGLEQDFLSPKEAFKESFETKNSSLIINLDLGKDIYLYADKVSVKIKKPQEIDITKELVLPKSMPYEEYIIYLYNLNIEVPFSLLKSKVDAKEYEIELNFQGCSKAGLCYAPMSKTTLVKIPDDFVTQSTTNSTSSTKSSNDLNETDTIANSLKDGNFFIILLTFFGFGLLLSLTPCVFPMIPILSSIIVKAGQNEQLSMKRGFFLSLVYVISMSLAYTIAGIIAGLFGANLQVALQNPYVLSAFAAIFVALAFSMFGYYKLELPQSVQNKINKTTEGKEKQGIFGIAIMGFLSALIVGPCVAPPLAGALVYIGQTGNAFLGGAALFVLSLGMGVPLLLIGLGAGKFMPKPGGWMENITRIFGIVMLAIAIWMLDRVLEPIIVMYLWSLLFLGTTLYLKLYEHILMRLITLVILIYGVLTFVGAVSGATNVLNPLEKFTSSKVVSTSEAGITFKRIKNLTELEAEIKKSDKPVMLDFYADWCVACKEFENITFKDDRVIEKLKGFTLLQADVTANNQDDKELQKRFNIIGPPGIIFWDKDNNEINASKIVGYKNPKEFLEILNKHFSSSDI
ncbi:protein-disulfide reductase DsbD [Arcobacter sp. F2176]|uniref:protein-disulfide reductase DsbD n=1 Tax=Arcobacter sp. F2176 TaxID=2044511 RepID=UPI00100B3654|nr:protein-disulfide reductase DsbD [Arcobacter sp. F2176]RXJ82240.1 thiol:disulfide interchange protein [Arcobacter sp. F2176]